MNCKDVLRDLSNYLDADLDPTLVQELKEHLRHCKECDLVVDTTRKTIVLYCDREPLPLPADVRQRLHRALAHKRHQPPD